MLASPGRHSTSPGGSGQNPKNYVTLVVSPSGPSTPPGGFWTET